MGLAEDSLAQMQGTTATAESPVSTPMASDALAQMQSPAQSDFQTPNIPSDALTQMQNGGLAPDLQNPTQPIENMANDAKNLLQKGVSAYKEVIPQPIQKGVQAIGTGIGDVFNVAETPFRAMKSGALAMENAGNELDAQGNPQVNPLVAAFQGAIGQRRDTIQDILNSSPMYRGMQVPALPGETPEQTLARKNKLQNTLTGTLGNVGEFAYDPILGMNPLGYTAKGQEALESGIRATDLGQAADRGERALLTVGNTPVVPNAIGNPVMQGFGWAQNKLRDFLPGFATKTTNPEFNAALDQGLLNPISYSNIQAQKMMDQDAVLIDSEAEKMGVDPQDLRKQMAEYIEPTGSQFEPSTPPGTSGTDQEGQDLKEAMINGQRADIASQWTPEIKNLADQYIQRNKDFFNSESPLTDIGERQFYMKHNITPEFREHLQDTFGENAPDLIPAAKSKSTYNPSAQGRNISDYTVNEINDLAQQGKLNQVYPDFPGLASFKGKVFDDQVERVAAQRFLQNAKITTTADFLNNIGRTYGLSDEAYRAGTRSGAIKESDYKWMPSPVLDGGGKYLPPEIADFLNKSSNILNPRLQKGLPQALKAVSDYVKLYNFGIYPKSSFKVYGSNNILSFLNGGWDLPSQLDAARIAAKARLGNLGTDATIDMGPKLGAMSEQQIWDDMAQKNRGVGMGLARAEMGYNTAKAPHFLSPQGKWGTMMMGAHNYVEDASRLGTYMHFLKEGYDPAGAASATRNALYDYSDLGEWDNKLKQMMPFYTFVRKNIPKMMELAVTQPGRMIIPEKIRQLVNQGHEQDENQLTEYQQDRMPWYVGKDANGKNLWWLSGDIIPEQQLNQVIGQGKTIGEQIGNTPKKALETVAGLSNPAIKTPIELAENFALYTHKPIQKMPGEQQNLINGIGVPSKLNYLLHQFRPVSEASQINNQGMGLPERALRALIGANVQAVDPQVSANYALHAQKNDINQMKSLVSFYARQAAIHRMQGETDQAGIDLQNMKTAIQHIQQLGVQP